MILKAPLSLLKGIFSTAELNPASVFCCVTVDPSGRPGHTGRGPSGSSFPLSAAGTIEVLAAAARCAETTLNLFQGRASAVEGGSETPKVQKRSTPETRRVRCSHARSYAAFVGGSLSYVLWVFMAARLVSVLSFTC